ncbi:MAG: carboxypeptidase regulatory-like domain-containing protein [Bacteroidota bacterium]
MLPLLPSARALRSAGFALALLASASFLQACDLGSEVEIPDAATLRGVVTTVNAAGAEVVVDSVTVSIDGTSFSVASGENGGYRFDGVPTGTYTVSTAAFDTLNAASAPITISRGGTGYSLDFLLTSD